MAYNFSILKEKLGSAEESLHRELSGIRTGRATPSILDTVIVESFGTKMPVKQVASIAVEDARTIRVIPWDTTQIKNIEKAVIQANLGIAIAVDEKGARLSFPELTAERRTVFIKLAKEKLEEAKIKMRNVRDDVWKDIQKKEKDGEISEDEKFRLKDDMQKIVDAISKSMEESFIKKESEIQS